MQVNSDACKQRSERPESSIHVEPRGIKTKLALPFAVSKVGLIGKNHESGDPKSRLTIHNSIGVPVWVR
jgi:hypothetical protein